jgi:DNA-binding transcriptional MocR family regulator
LALISSPFREARLFASRDVPRLPRITTEAVCFPSAIFFLLTRLEQAFLTNAPAPHFCRFKLLLSDDPSEDGDSKAVIETTAFNRGVLALPGTAFLPNGRKTAYVRASFSLTLEEDVDTAIGRLRDAILDAKKELLEKKAV